MTLARPPFVALLATLLLSCNAPGGEPAARASDAVLTAEELAALVAPMDRVTPDRPGLVQVADLWIDFTLLATAYAEDSTLSQVDLAPLVDERAEQEMVVEFRRTVVQLDTAIAETELQTRYASDDIDDLQVRARHILLAWPRDATTVQVDSVRRLAASLRQRVEDGEDFAALARRYSDDPDYAGAGGDIGYFLPGAVIEPIERVAYSLEPGELSEPFTSELGVHLIRVEDRRTPPYADFRAWIQQRRTTQAEARFVNELVGRAEVERREGVLDVVRRIAENPRQPFDSIPEDEPLVTYGDGGSLDVAEVRRFIQSRPVPFQIAAASASSEELDRLILGTLIQGERLTSAAAEAGIRITTERRAEIREEARVGLLELTRRIGLRPSDDSDAATRETVDIALERTLTGAQEVIPLGLYSYALWKARGGEIVDNGIDQAVEAVRAARNLDFSP